MACIFLYMCSVAYMFKNTSHFSYNRGLEFFRIFISLHKIAHNIRWSFVQPLTFPYYEQCLLTHRLEILWGLFSTVWVLTLNCFWYHKLFLILLTCIVKAIYWKRWYTNIRKYRYVYRCWIKKNDCSLIFKEVPITKYFFEKKSWESD